jgi:hypothetical protein
MKVKKVSRNVETRGKKSEACVKYGLLDIQQQQQVVEYV